MNPREGAASDQDRPNKPIAAKRFDEMSVRRADAIDHVRSEGWEQHALATLPRGPRYGSSAWLELPEGDPRRWRGVVAFAAVWRRQLDPAVIAVELRADLAERDREARRRIRQAGLDVHAAAGEVAGGRGLLRLVLDDDRAASARRNATAPRPDSRPTDLEARRRWVQEGR